MNSASLSTKISAHRDILILTVVLCLHSFTTCKQVVYVRYYIHSSPFFTYPIQKVYSQLLCKMCAPCFGSLQDGISAAGRSLRGGKFFLALLLRPNGLKLRATRAATVTYFFVMCATFLSLHEEFTLLTGIVKSHERSEW